VVAIAVTDVSELDGPGFNPGDLVITDQYATSLDGTAPFDSFGVTEHLIDFVALWTDLRDITVFSGGAEFFWLKPSTRNLAS
jgi:hypothetical protein